MNIAYVEDKDWQHCSKLTNRRYPISRQTGSLSLRSLRPPKPAIKTKHTILLVEICKVASNQKKLENLTKNVMYLLS